MRFSNITYLVSEGFKNVFKNKRASMASLLTMIAAMIMFGIFFVIGENANYIVDQVATSQGIQVFMDVDASQEEMDSIKEQIWDIGEDKIATVTFVSKQEALESMKETLGSDSDLLDAYEGDNNIFPASYIVTLSDLTYNGEVQQAIWEIEGVDKITSSNETIDTLIKIANGVNIAIAVIFVFLIVIAVTIIANTIRLSVLNRRKEISIMKYVGATDGFIRWPFVIEGIIIGIISSFITLLILGTAYNALISRFAESTVFQRMAIQLLQFNDMIGAITVIFLALGIGIGVIGSAISMKRYLEV